jgi:peptidylprolyl isomerase
MKLSSALFVFSAILPASAQTATTHPAAKPAGTAAARPAASTACAKLPEMSPKVPALPPGSPCARHLYTIAVIPTVKLENVSPFEPATLQDDLGIDNKFSLDYVDTRVGTGELATAHTWDIVNYAGYLLDGTKFDANDGFPFAPAQHQVIPGWFTGVAGMHVGGKRRLYIPFQLAYGANAHGSIPARSALIFDIELVSTTDTAPKPKAPPTPPTPPPAPPKPAGAPATPPPGAPATPPASTPPPTTPPATPPPASSTPPKP